MAPASTPQLALTGYKKNVYRLIGRLEQGELADLFRAERLEGGDPVVMKLFHPHTSNAAYAAVVSSTALALRRVRDGRIAHIVDVGLHQGQLAVVREDRGRFTLGFVLQRLNTREVVLPPALALALVLELLEVLGAAHAQGVIHGALTPGNVLVDESGRLSLAEFGALAALQASTSLLDSFGSRGRASYRAPELRNVLSPATIASDLYAVGAITYELLTLREAAVEGQGFSTRGERLPPPSRLVRRLNSRIDPVIMRTLEANPARRPRSCAELADGLRDVLSAQGGLPGHDEFVRFVTQLLPNEVVAAPLGPVPFEAPFALEPLANASPVETVRMEIAFRPPFSGGEVDARVPTSDGLPVFDSTAPEVVTQPDHRAATWDAPPGPMPEFRSDSPVANPEILKARVRVYDEPTDPEVAAPRRESRPLDADAKQTVVTYAVNFKREGEVDLPDYPALRAQAGRVARRTQALGALILSLTVLGMMIFWYRTTPNPWATFLSYLPRPVERAFQPRLPPGPPPGPAPSSTVKLAPYPEPQPPPSAARPSVDGGTQAKSECYEPPRHGKTATVHLVVVVKQLTVSVDGATVCGSPTPLVLTPGQHTLEFAAGSELQRVRRDFKAGTSEKLVPFKQGR